MTIKIEGKNVHVCDRDCRSRPCFQLGQDKGSFTPGKGYTSYHTKPRWVCMRRLLRGCPSPLPAHDPSIRRPVNKPKEGV